SPEYDILFRWVAGGLQPDSAGTPVLQKLVVTPNERVLVEPADRLPIRVQAVFSDGTTRDVTRPAVYGPSDPMVRVTPDGEVQRQQWGESAVLVRYLDQRVAVQVAFVPARPSFVWAAPPEANYVDHHIFAELRTLRVQPSPPCSDSIFLRRAFLD